MRNGILFWNEVLATFSRDKSYFCSKKIERFISFSLATMIIVVYFILRMCCVQCVESIDATSIVWLSGSIYAYGGYNTFMIQKDKKLDNDSSN